MYPILFEIPGLGFPIRSFGVLVAGGIFLGIWIWGRLLAVYGDDPEEDPLRSSQVAVWVVVGILLGARMMYVTVESSRYLRADVTEEMELYLAASDRGAAAGQLVASAPEQLEAARKIAVGYDFLHDPVKILLIWQGGLVMYGGMFGGMLLGMWSTRRYGLAMWNGLDTCMVAAFFGMMVGRWGCFLVGDDFGKLVPPEYADLPFPITLTVPTREWLGANPQSLFPAELAGSTLWATQLWMSFNAILVALVGWLVLKRRTWMGQVTATVLIHYSITRFLIEMFRGDEIRGVWFGGAVSTSQLVSIGGFALGILLFVKKPGPRVGEKAVAKPA